MSDVILTFPVVSGEEDRLFDLFFDRFTEDRASRIEACGEETPFLMLRSDPSRDGAVKVVTFQEQDLASAFMQGWAQLRRRWATGAA
jgi:hypothetical protein